MAKDLFPRLRKAFNAPDLEFMECLRKYVRTPHPGKQLSDLSDEEVLQSYAPLLALAVGHTVKKDFEFVVTQPRGKRGDPRHAAWMGRLIEGVEALLLGSSRWRAALVEKESVVEKAVFVIAARTAAWAPSVCKLVEGQNGKGTQSAEMAQSIGGEGKENVEKLARTDRMIDRMCLDENDKAYLVVVQDAVADPKSAKVTMNLARSRHRCEERATRLCIRAWGCAKKGNPIHPVKKGSNPAELDVDSLFEKATFCFRNLLLHARRNAWGSFADASRVAEEVQDELNVQLVASFKTKEKKAEKRVPFCDEARSVGVAVVEGGVEHTLTCESGGGLEAPMAAFLRNVSSRGRFIEQYFPRTCTHAPPFSAFLNITRTWHHTLPPHRRDASVGENRLGRLSPPPLRRCTRSATPRTFARSPASRCGMPTYGAPPEARASERRGEPEGDATPCKVRVGEPASSSALTGAAPTTSLPPLRPPIGKDRASPSPTPP